MADCSKTVDFLLEWKRLFDNTEIISLRDPKTQKEVLVYNQMMSDLEHPEQTIRYVQKWSDEHPVMTWEGKLRELLPNVDMKCICHFMCPHDIFGGQAPQRDQNTCDTYVDCDHCWSGEYKEIKENENQT